MLFFFRYETQVRLASKFGKDRVAPSFSGSHTRFSLPIILLRASNIYLQFSSAPSITGMPPPLTQTGYPLSHWESRKISHRWREKMGREEERLHFMQSALLSFFVSGVDGRKWGENESERRR